ncbi:MAG: hypothetical protein EP330_03670 [Deltaproteobacteria bacterium]|nr:MAG: hypothetical protein EP330_03670 [Deltaproteobacteria bacterium]
MTRNPPTSSALAPLRSTLRTGVCLLLAGLATGCGAPKVYIKAMSAASVDIPTRVQRVAVIDRSQPKNAGETALGVLEGVVTGEAPLEDNEGRRLAISELVATLEAAPRFEVVRPAVTSKEVDSTLMDKPWTYKEVVKLCQEHGCDAVIALETFDTDAKLASGLIEGAVTAATQSAPAPSPATPTPNPAKPATVGGGGTIGGGGTTGGGSTTGGGTTADTGTTPAKGTTPEPATSPTTDTATTDPATDEPPPFTHWAQRTTRINATWRMYDASADAILDEERDRVMGSQRRAEGYTIEEAVGKLASASSMISSDGRKLGKEYGTRISPTWVGLQRKYFAGGALKMGKRYVLAGDWDGAIEQWKAVVDDPSASLKTKGKARHNLAVAAEMKGQLKKAHKLAQKAAVENNHKISQGYARSLERRIEEQERVERQLAAPEEAE